MRRVLLLEAAGPESGALARAAVASGCQVHAVTDAATAATYGPELRDLLAGFLVTRLDHPTQALGDILGYARRIGASAVLTANEYLTELHSRVCAALGLPGNDPQHAVAARSKAAMAAAFACSGVSAPRTHILTQEGELHAMLTSGQLSVPCVVKPADAAGSAGVTVLTEKAGASAAWRAARSVEGMYGQPRDPRVVVQEYVEGIEYSVESLTWQGRTRHLCTTAKTLTPGPHPVEIGHSLPITLPPRLEGVVHRQVERAITATGIRNGASHIEVILTPEGRCTVIEIAARFGAGHIGTLLRHALGINPWKAVLDVALGRQPDLAATRRGYATVRFLTSPRPGRLIAVRGLPGEGPGVPAVALRVSPGQMVAEPTANRGRLGHIILTGPEPAAVERRAEHLLAQISIDVHPAPAGVRP